MRSKYVFDVCRRGPSPSVSLSLPKNSARRWTLRGSWPVLLPSRMISRNARRDGWEPTGYQVFIQDQNHADKLSFKIPSQGPSSNKNESIRTCQNHCRNPDGAACRAMIHSHSARSLSHLFVWPGMSNEVPSLPRGGNDDRLCTQRNVTSLRALCILVGGERMRRRWMADINRGNAL